MAAVTLLGSLFDTNAGTHTVTATPAAGDLIVLVVANTGYTGTTAPTDNNSDGLGTYTLAESRVKNTSADTLQVYIRDALVGSGTSTVFTHAAGAGTTGGGLAVVKVTGMSRAGANAKAKSGGLDNKANNGSTAVAWTGGGSASGTNPLIGVILNGNTTSAGQTKPASFDQELLDVGYSNPTTGIEIVSDDTGNTDSTVTWGDNFHTLACNIILELDSTALAFVPRIDIFTT